MKLMLRLTLSFLIVISLAGLTMAHDAERLKIADLASDPDGFAGRTVEVKARVAAINADGQSIELFDSLSYTRISVQLAQLPKTEREALIRSDVREVLVRGRLSVVAGRLTIQAESVEWGNKEAPTQEVVPVSSMPF
ncbi:MAG TPA: hypothetical protein VFR12_09665 [Pyrinomonadaceae bacterium]|nr:hypothetical protein [Pyrinomonadaceae bacterium]